MVQFQVSELRLPLVAHSATKRPLYPHQSAMFSAFQGPEGTSSHLLAAKTGCGKTLAAMLPLLRSKPRSKESAVAIYPTNELLRDQIRSTQRLADEEGISTVVWTPEVRERPEYKALLANSDRLLVPMDARLLDEWQKKLRSKSRGATLGEILRDGSTSILFTNPDILYLILSLKYQAESIEALCRFKTLIIDEFHLYHGVELAHLVAMIEVARSFRIFRRLIFLSATPDPAVRELLHRAFGPNDVEFRTAVGDAEGSRIAVHSVEVTPIQCADGDPVDILHATVIKAIPELQRLREAESDAEYLPGIVVVNSVANAIRLEDRLVESGVDRRSLAIIRGMSNRAIRDLRSKTLAIGTSAIEVGVDFHCDHLFFEASDAGSFLQRFGRAGRHRPAKVSVLVPPNVMAGMRTLPGSLSRVEFEERINAWYPRHSAYEWFVTTHHGMVAVRSVAENLVRIVARDSGSEASVVNQLRTKLNVVIEQLAARLDCEVANRRAASDFSRCLSGKTAARWLSLFLDNDAFRSSLPSITIHDFTEMSRRSEWQLGEYDLDLRSLLSRGVDIKWSERLRKLTIQGIGRYRRPFVSENVAHGAQAGEFRISNNDQMSFCQEGGAPWSATRFFNDQPRVFVIVPKQVVREHIDWRMPVFDVGSDQIIAFDSSALLLAAIYERCLAD